MVYKEDDIKEQLWAYIDNACDEADALRIKELIDSDRQWQQAYNSLVQTEALIIPAVAPDQPSLRFSKNVMDAIAAAIPAPARKYINSRVVKGIAAFFLLTIAVSFMLVLLQINLSEEGGGLLKGKLPQVEGQMIWHTVKYALAPATIILILILLDGIRKKKHSQSASL